VKLALLSPALALIATLAFAQNPPTAIKPIPVVINSGTITLNTCGTLVCYYVLDMRATATITLAQPLNGQALVFKAWQNPSFGGGFTPTFAGPTGCPTIKWSGGAPPAAVTSVGNSQMYSLVADTQTESTCVFNEMRPGAE